MNLLEAYLQRIRQAVEHIPTAAADFYLEQLLSSNLWRFSFK